MREERLVSKRFEEARTEIGLTQSELADKSNVSRATISHLENGEIDKLATDKLFEIACNLQKPISFFYKPIDDSYTTISEITFRSFKTKAGKDNRKAKIKLYRIVDILSYLYKYIEGRSLDISILDDVVDRDYNDNEIESIAYLLRKSWGMTMGPVIGLTTIMENHGIICCSTSLPQKIDSLNISVRFPEDGIKTAVVIYNQDLNYFRQRFSLAHELGHIVLHHYWTKQEFIENEDLAEYQANRFASAFLMPYDSFIQSVGNTDLRSTLVLKEKWKTSIQAICHRLKDTGLISETRYRNMNAEISQRRWRKKEPGDDTVKNEEPYYLTAGYNYILGNNIVSSNDVLDTIAIPANELVNYIGNAEWLSPARPDLEYSLKGSR